MNRACRMFRIVDAGLVPSTAPANGAVRSADIICPVHVSALDGMNEVCKEDPKIPYPDCATIIAPLTGPICLKIAVHASLAKA
jgi:hypothetical protein